MSDLDNDAYGHTISKTTDGTTDFYLVGGSLTYSFPHGTPQNAAYLAIAIRSNLLAMRSQVQDYIQSLYSRDQQIQFAFLYMAAQKGGLTNRATYIGQLLDWVNSIFAYTASYTAAIQALTNPATVAATSIDITQIPADPGITMLAAQQIPD